MYNFLLIFFIIICLGNGLTSASASSSSSYSDKYPSYNSPRLDGVRGLGNCICVPYDQCRPHDIARKEDGFHIDPRTNGGKNIEAITLDDVVITDGNGTIISRHSKRENDDDEITAENLQDEENRAGSEVETEKPEEVKEGNNKEEKNGSRRRREVPDKNDNGNEKSNIQPVSYILLPIITFIKQGYPKATQKHIQENFSQYYIIKISS